MRKRLTQTSTLPCRSPRAFPRMTPPVSMSLWILTIANNFNQVGEALKEAQIPSYTAADAMVTGGGAFSFSIDYAEIGEMTADMVLAWYDGTPLSELPVQRVEDFTLVYNTDVIAALGIDEADVTAYADSVGLPSQAVETVTAE